MSRLKYSEFRDRIDVDAFEEAIGFAPLHHHKGNDVGYCPWPENHKHGDTTGKFAIHREKLVWNCYVCGGGDLVSLPMLLWGWEVDTAIEWLYQFAVGDTRTDDEFADYLVSLLGDEKQSESRLPYFHSKVLDRFHDDPSYFVIERGISPEVVTKYNLRFAQEAFKPAPVRTTRDGDRIKIDHDYIGPAAIWPHYWQGRLMGWQYRWIDFDKAHTKTPKWLSKWTNTTDFPKYETIFNYEEALKSPRPVLCVESVATALFAITYDIPAVAYFGSKPTPVQLRWLRRYGHGLIFCPDNDSGKTGEMMYGHLRETIAYLERFVPLWLAPPVTIKEGADLGDYADTADPERNLLEHLDRAEEVGISV